MAARSQVVGVALLIASVIAMGLSVYSGIRSAAYARCQSLVTEALIASQAARARASDADWAALDTLVTDLARTDDPRVEQRLRAEYAATRARTQADRDAHPLPAPPSQACR